MIDFTFKAEKVKGLVIIMIIRDRTASVDYKIKLEINNYMECIQNTIKTLTALIILIQTKSRTFNYLYQQ